MQINTCDNCGQKIERKESLDVRFGYDHVELCMGCGKPVVEFLQKQNLYHEVKKS